MKRQTNRRQFVKQSAIAGLGFWAAGGLTLADSKSPNETVNIACIGVGGKGDSDTDQAANFGNIVALCDIDDSTLNDKAGKFPKAKKYNDFRKMLEEMDKSIDAVTVSTPDHTHAVASIMAMKMGKHVYCQKPLTHSVYEARMMREVAAKQKVATQMGNQGTAENGLRRAVEIIQAGAIGPVRQVHVWTNRPTGFWSQAPQVTSRPKETPGIPNHIHWYLFLGPAPDRPYHPAYHPFAWRGWWDFGTGALGDMACHTANMAFRALKLGYPTSIVAESGEINPETYPAWAKIHFDFPAREELPPVKFTWYEGKKDGQRVLPSADLTKGLQMSDSGSLLVGDKGILFSPNDYGDAYKLLPEKDFEGYEGPKPTLPRNGRGDDGMKAEWVAAIKGGPPAMSNFDYAAMLTETILLGNVAMRVGKKIEWDGPHMKVTNCPEAEQYIKPEFRKGWHL
ncbi:MAG TPA: Gfo/Idh/MocA family oxidoreductase [Gemmataceae bacterium]|nr:Gfo/Idh/MocA family oxidoreductase [Gemmataceae bacterium]